MKPVEINDFLSQQVIGQEDVLRYVSVAIFKHLQGEKYGNLLLIGNSGTGKTTIMRAIENLYASREDFREHRVVLIMNANTLSTEEGAVDTGRLFAHFADAETECQALTARGLALPAYDQCLKASHLFNLLDARGVISVTERAAYIGRVRALARACCEAWLAR